MAFDHEKPDFEEEARQASSTVHRASIAGVETARPMADAREGSRMLQGAEDLEIGRPSTVSFTPSFGTSVRRELRGEMRSLIHGPLTEELGNRHPFLETATGMIMSGFGVFAAVKAAEAIGLLSAAGVTASIATLAFPPAVAIAVGGAIITTGALLVSWGVQHIWKAVVHRPW